MSYCLLILFFIISCISVYGYEIIDDSVVFDNAYINIEVTPHTIQYPWEEQSIKISSKDVSGDLCYAFSFDKKLKSSSINAPISIKRNMIKYIDSEYNYHYYSENPVSFDVFETKQLKYSFNPSYKSGKYDVTIWSPKPGYTCKQAYVNSNNRYFLYSLDPWWNVSYSSCRNVTYLGGGERFENFPVYINIDDTTDMNTDGSDIVFVDSGCNNGGNVMDFEIENITTNNVTAWVLIPELNVTGGTISFYYNNSNATDMSNKTNVWGINYTGVYHLSEGAGTAINDSTVYDNNGTISDSDQWSSSCMIAGCYDFVDGDTWIDCDNDITLKPQNELTISAWIKADTTNVDASLLSIIATGNGATANGGYVLWTEDRGGGLGTDGVRTFLGDTNLELFFKYDNVFSATEKWYHLAVTYNDSDDYGRIYVNGVNVNSQFGVLPNGLQYTAGRTLYIGKDHDNRYWNEKIDEVRISSRAYNSYWINYEYQNIANQSNYITINPLIEHPDLTNDPPEFTESIPNFDVYFSNETNTSLNYTGNFTDNESDPVNASSSCDFLNPVEVNNTVLTFNFSYTANYSDEGTNNCYIYLDDGTNVTTSNLFTVTVTNNTYIPPSYSSNASLAFNGIDIYDEENSMESIIFILVMFIIFATLFVIGFLTKVYIMCSISFMFCFMIGVALVQFSVILGVGLMFLSVCIPMIDKRF